MKATEFNRQWKTRRGDAEKHLPALTAAYDKALARVERDAIRAFRSQLVASPWQPPPEGNILDPQAATAAAAPSVTRLYRQIVFSTAGPTLARLGISWDVTGPFAAQLIEGTAQRTGAAVLDAVRPIMQETILGAYEEGLSVPDTASLLQDKLAHARPISAAMLARTDLNGIANGSSVMTAQLVGVPYKAWVTAHDERVRPSHVGANGQTVPVAQPFQVGGETAMYPADPDLSDEEACNCRCTVVYTDGIPGALVAAVSPETDEVMRRMADLAERLERTLERMERPRTRRVIVQRDADGDIVGMTIREDTSG